MLIEFSVANYRSFRDRQTLSMVAAPRIGRKENTFSPALDGERFPDLLRAVAVYGPNASGKSNLLRALEVVDRIANRPPTPHPYPLPVTPFAFDRALIDQPSVFELHFVRSGLRYSFELAATATRIVRERLASFPRGKESLIYERSFDPKFNGEAYTFGPTLMAEVGGEVVDAWRKLTSPTLLFIAQAVANSSGDIKVLRLPFGWLSEASLTLIHGMDSMAQGAQNLIYKGHAENEIASFLRELDVPVSRVKVAPVDEDSRLGLNALSQPALSDNAAAPAKDARKPPRRFRTTLTHRTALGEADIAFEDESEGTKNLFGFWLPWVTRDYRDANDPRCLLVVDEIDSSLHPKIVEALVGRHLSAQQVSQLIFTTHDTHLMDSGLLRRDQIWITERDANGATQLRSIHDFKGRQSEDIEKRYYEGRYRGLPLTTKG